MTNMAASDVLPHSSSIRTSWEARYRSGPTPWDTQTTPPEVIEFWQQERNSRQGIALDLGCGPGTNVHYLAGVGLTAIGVEIASAPILLARQRFNSVSSSIRRRMHMVCSDVCLLPFRGLGAKYILDIGCFHSLPLALRSLYVEGVTANIARGGYYHLFAFDADPENIQPVSGPPGMGAGEVAEHFAPILTVVEETIARPDRRPCRWYLLQAPP